MTSVLEKLGIQQLNAMQEEAIQTIDANNNTILLSPTGTGKTVAFLMPIIKKLDKTLPEVQALILVPSRELAMQIEGVMRQMGTGFKVDAVYGGRSGSKDRMQLKSRPAVLVGTPGRVADHLRRGTFSTEDIDTLVLDEERTKLFGGVETMKTITLIDTLSYYSVKDSIFKGSDRYKTMMNVGVGKEGAKFKLEAGKLDEFSVFEASVEKSVVLDGEEPYLIEKEKQVVSVDGVNGPTLKVGSMTEVFTKGNWPKSYTNKE